MGKALPAVTPHGGPGVVVRSQGGALGDPYPSDSAAGRNALCDNTGASTSAPVHFHSTSASDSISAHSHSMSDPNVMPDISAIDSILSAAKYGNLGGSDPSTPNTHPSTLTPAGGAAHSPPKILCLDPTSVEILLSNDADSEGTPLTTMDPHDPAIIDAVSQVMSRVEACYSGYKSPPATALMALEHIRRTSGRLDIDQAASLLRPQGRAVPSHLGLTTRLSITPLALDQFLASALLGEDRISGFAKLYLDPQDQTTKDAMLRVVEAAQRAFPNSVLSASTVYHALLFSRTTNPDARVDVDRAFSALLPLSFINTPPTSDDWDFPGLNSVNSSQNPISPRRRVTPVSTPSWRHNSELTTPPLPASWLETPSTPDRRRVSFEDLGRQYRVGTKRPLGFPLSNAGGDHVGEHEGYEEGSSQGGDGEEAEEVGDEDSERSSDDDEASDDSEGSEASRVSSASHKKKSARKSTTAQVLELITSLLARSNQNGKTAMLAKPPELWQNGEAPKGGYFLDTFTRLYGLYKAFTNISGDDCGLTFKSLITEGIEPTVRSHLKLKRDQDWDTISNSELIKALKSNLGFKDKDYYVSRLEEFQLPSNTSPEDKIFSSFVQQTSEMLAIEAEGVKTGVVLRRPTIKNIFHNYVRRHYRLSQWFHERSFKSLASTVRHIGKEYKKEHVRAKRKSHEKRQNALANGARSDYRGGKVEPGDAADSRDAARQKRGIFKDSRGAGSSRGSPRTNHSSRGGTPSRGSDRGGHQSRSDRGDRGGGRGNSRSGTSGRPDLREAYAAEDSMDKGRFWHEKGPYCKVENCRARVCQGCNYHSSADDPGHDRPHCPNSEHKDFVAAPKYFHEAWPGRKTALVPPGKTPGGAAKANSVSHKKEEE